MRQLYVFEDSHLDFEHLQRLVSQLDPCIQLHRFETAIEIFNWLESLGGNTEEDQSSTISTARYAIESALLIDLNLPGIRGRELLAALCKEPSLDHCPVFVMSTSGHANDRTLIEHDRVEAYFQKPLHRDDVERLQNALMPSSERVHGESGLEGVSREMSDAMAYSDTGDSFDLILIDDDPLVREQAKHLSSKLKKRIVLPESSDEATLAINQLAEKICDEHKWLTRVAIDFRLWDDDGLVLLTPLIASHQRSGSPIACWLMSSTLPPPGVIRNAQAGGVQFILKGELLTREGMSALMNTPLSPS